MTFASTVSDPANDTPPAPSARQYSADELKRIAAETRALVTVAARALIGRTIEQASVMGAQGGSAEGAALLDRVRGEIAAAQAEWSAGGRATARAQHRSACDMLRLYRVCERERCRKAQGCCGNALACYERFDVPESVEQWLAARLLAERVPALALLIGDGNGRAAYECWIAGLETGARSSHHPCQPRPKRGPQ